MELSPDQLDDLFDAVVVDSTGDRFGTVGQIYLDDVTERPSFITVRTGLLGQRETFVPVRGIVLEGRTVTLPWTRDRIREAPEVETEGHLDEPDQIALLVHYGLEPERELVAPPVPEAAHPARATTEEGITVVTTDTDVTSSPATAPPRPDDASDGSDLSARSPKETP